MKKIQIDTIIFDFDSTVLRGELLEILADIKLQNHPRKAIILDKIKTITDLGQEGKIDFSESLTRRLKLLKLDEKTLSESLEKIKSLINDEYLEILPVFKRKNKHIISGGYKNIIDKLSDDLFIPRSDIHAIKLHFENGNFTHFDATSPLISSDGKAKVAKSISNKGKTLVIGDGMTDYKVKELGGADYFAAYTGVVHRPAVVAKADFVLTNLGNLPEYII